jgi:hypothetical protein
MSFINMLPQSPLAVTFCKTISFFLLATPSP